MTNTDKTLSTERLEELLRLEIGERDRYLEGTFLWLKHDDKANAFAELIAKRTLASRTQSPAEWQVEAGRHAVELEQCAIFAADVGPSIAKAMTDAADFLRAASITPPASERSREEVGVSANGVERINAILDHPSTSPQHDLAAIRQAIAHHALEPASLHKGEAVGWRWRYHLDGGGLTDWCFGPDFPIEGPVTKKPIDVEPLYTAPAAALSKPGEQG